MTEPTPSSKSHHAWNELRERIEECLIRDRGGLRDGLAKLTRAGRGGRPSDRRGDRRGGRGVNKAGESADELMRAIDRSIAARKRRVASVPRVTYPADLPVAQRRQEIADAIRQNQVVIVCGETGSGKTTQLPKICLELGRGVLGAIGHTQPRRIAARTIAARISDELSRPLGQVVGYKVRFGDRIGPDTLVKVMTDGILLAETQSDALLEQYDTLIIDEAHERSLNIDFLLGYLRGVLTRRPDLKVIVTSATIDPQRFAEHFATEDASGARVPAPVIEVSGRTYPVEIRYEPIARPPSSDTDDPDEDEPDMQESILRAVDELCAINVADPPRDILVFLSGEREIRETAENLRKHHPPTAPQGSRAIEVLPLYARLSIEEQARVFAPSRKPESRRIVLATNVAETSLTVPGIRYVIDPGFARVSRYSPRNKVQRLPIEPISRASADQRAGRCGRLAAGVCIRLYTQEDYKDRPEFNDPEILRTNLASVILQMKALRLGRIEQFPFIDPPDERAIRDGLETLEELGAVDAKGELTPLGADLARLPIDPRIGRMVLAARQEECIDEVLIIASALSIQDPRERPFDSREQADKVHESFRGGPAADFPASGLADASEHQESANDQSDFLTFLNVWNAYQERARQLSTNKLRAWCKSNYLSPVRMREWRDVHHQLGEVVGAIGLRRSTGEKGRATTPPAPRHRPDEPVRDRGAPPGGQTPCYAAIHRALLAGLLSNVATLTDRFEYTGPRGIKASIFPGSALFRNQPRWIVAGELVRTTRLYARTVARIQPGWIEKVGAHLVKRTYSEPYWNERVAQVWASERVTFMGLELVPHRRVQFGSVDPVAARQIFIHRAIVEREYWSTAAFAKHNRQLIAEAHELQARFRRHDLMADSQALFQFFDALIPESVYSGRAFEQWLKQASRENPRLLFLSREDLLPTGPGEPTLEEFPDWLEFGGARLPLEYRYEPGEATDGVTLVIPVGLLAAAREERCDWLIPGLIREKVIALMRTLPKHIRRLLVPAPQFAERALGSMKFGEGALLTSLASALSRLSGEPIGPSDFGAAELPGHLQIRFRVEEGAGAERRTLAEGRDLAAIRVGLREHLVDGFSPGGDDVASEWNRDGLTAWDFDELPEEIHVSRNGLRVTGHPAIVDPATLSGAAARQSHGVCLRVLESRDRADRATRLGLGRLFAMRVRDEIVFLIRNSPAYDKLALQYGVLGAVRDMEEGLALLVSQRAFLSHPGEIRTRAQFEARLDAGWHRLGETVSEAVGLVRQILDAHQAFRLRLESTHSASYEAAYEDERQHVEALLAPGFLIRTQSEALGHYPRYLRASLMRLEKLGMRGPQKDEQLAAQARSVWRSWQERAARREADGVDDPALERFRWLIEEWRVSLFAQELGVAEPVSAQRLEKRWAEVRT